MWMKREDLQPVFSFKLHGAYNMMARLPREQLDRGFICSSARNHAQGVALATKNLNCSAVITMPVTTPEIKWKSVERLGAMAVLIGDSYTMRLKLMLRSGRKRREGTLYLLLITRILLLWSPLMQMKWRCHYIMPVKEVGEETFRLCKDMVDGVVLVSRDANCGSIKDMFEERRGILKPAGALSLADAEAYCKYYGLVEK
ncbi:hypothetical protein ACFX2A_014847 [Malus domestica]